MNGPPRPVAQVDASLEAPLVVGEPVAVSPRVRRLLAPNPSVMTGPGTNTYLIGTDDVTVIDPGPADDSHVAAIIAAAEADGGRLARIVCTHTHSDHWPATDELARRTGAEVLAYASRDGLEVTGTLADGDGIEAGDHTLRLLHTPGHASNHLCVLLTEEHLLFTGDHIMQGVTVVIAPPDGDMGAYMASLARISSLDPPLARIAPAHGYVLDDPAAVIAAYVAHRTAREELVAEALAGVTGTATVDDLVPVVYADVDEALYPVARLSLWAHLRKLVDDGRATVDDRDALDTGHWAPV